MAKKTICLITNWYPTKENPYVGLFFKEQAFAVAEDFNFIVVHYKEKRFNSMVSWLVRKIFCKDYELREINKERNTIEYDLKVKYPLIMYVCDLLVDVWCYVCCKLKYKSSIIGVGRYISNFHKTSKKEALSRIFKKHFDGKIDVLYCVDAQNESSTLWYVSQALNIPFVVSEHGPFPWPGDVINDMEHEAIEKADSFIAISQDKIRQVMLQNVCLKKIVYLGNMIDDSQFCLGAEAHTVKTLLIVAAHSFYKNYNLFIDVLNRLTEITLEPFKVMIVGYGANKGYSVRVNEFEQQIKNSKFYDRVAMIPEVGHSEIQNIYHQADVFVMTSIQEGQPVSALEAACCGLPIFSTRCGGVEDYVDDCVGRIYNLNDKDSFASGLKDFLEGKIVFDNNLIRQSVINKYGTASFQKKFKAIFETAINKKENV